MNGVALGQVLNFRFGISMFHHGISLFHCVMGGAVALRQTSIHICQKTPLVSEPVFGLSLYVWSFIIFVCAVIVIGFLMMMFNPKWKSEESKGVTYFERFASIYLFAIIIVDMIIIGMVCGWGLCPDN